MSALPAKPPDGWAKELNVGDMLVLVYRRGVLMRRPTYAYQVTKVTKVGSKRFCISHRDLWFRRDTGMVTDGFYSGYTVFPATDANLLLLAEYRKEAGQKKDALESEKKADEAKRLLPRAISGRERARTAADWVAHHQSETVLEVLSVQTLNDIYDELERQGML